MIDKHAGYYKNVDTQELVHFWVQPKNGGIEMSAFESPNKWFFNSKEEIAQQWEFMQSYSFSTLRLLHECPHNYLNKINKIKQPESDALKEGKAAHRIMQDHVSGVKPHPCFEHIDLKFDVVETKDFDPRCKFEVPFGDYVIFGYIDGLDKPVKEEPTVMLEGKFSSSPWGLTKYKRDPQRKICGWAVRSLKEAYLLTGLRRPEQWETTKLKTARVPFKPKDYSDAEEWMLKAIKMIEEGDFLSDLVNGKCVNPRCYWGENCMFK